VPFYEETNQALDLNLGLYNIHDFGPVGGADDTATFNAAITAAPTGGVIYIPSGTYNVNQITISKQLSFIGTSHGSVTLKAVTGATGPLINFAPIAATSNCRLGDFTVDLTNATGIAAIGLSNFSTMGILENVVVSLGTIGITISAPSGAVGGCYIRNCRLANQTTAGISIGDNVGELYFDDIDISRTTAGTLADGFLLSRTSATDLGGFYLTGVRVTNPGGTLTNGFRFTCSSGTATIPFFMEECVADGWSALGFLLSNVQNGRCANSWFAGAGSAIRITGGQDLTFAHNWTDGGASGNCFEWTNTANLHTSLIGNRCNQGTAFTLPATNPPTSLHLIANNCRGTTNTTNDTAKLAAAQISSSYAVERSQADIAPRALGLTSWAFDFDATAGNSALTAGTIYCFGVPLRMGESIANVWLGTAVAAAGTAPTNFFMGLCDSTGKMLAITGDVKASGSLSGTGVNSFALQAATTIASDGMYFVVALQVGSWGTTQPTFQRGANAFATVGAAFRFATAGAGQTVLPAVNSSLTLSASSFIAAWAGVS